MATKQRSVGDGVTIRLGKVASCTFDKEWLNPVSKKIIYYHDVITDMGDILSIGAMEKNSPRIKKGAMIEYILDQAGKTKIISSSSDAKKIAEQAVADKQARGERASVSMNRTKGQEAYLGFSWSYAKDLIIAGKTMNDVEELNKVARYIYEQMGKMLNQETE
jgi:hypothetical protein